MGGSAKGQTFTHFEKYLPNTQVPELLIYDETQYVVDRLDEVKLLVGFDQCLWNASLSHGK